MFLKKVLACILRCWCPFEYRITSGRVRHMRGRDFFATTNNPLHSLDVFEKGDGSSIKS